MIELKNKYTGDVVEKFLGTQTISNVKFDRSKDFRYVDFENLELLKCDFSEVDLSGVEFKHCLIGECDFYKSTLVNTEFNFCELNFCKFNHSDLSESYFCHCEIRDCDYSWSKMEDNIIEMSYLSNVSFEGIRSSSFEICHSMLNDVAFLKKSGTMDVEFRSCSLQNISFDAPGFNGCKFSDCAFDYISIDGNLIGNNIGSKTVQTLIPSANNSCNICQHFSLLSSRCIKHQINCIPSGCCVDFEG